ncbi:hypothetical protein L7F22_059755 [Adiantum nelumboides]|nr:hypothetical protein [Adiantum nelumboides]
MQELHIEVGNPLIIYSGSQSAIALVRNDVFHSKMQHIDVSYREQIQLGDINLIHCLTEDTVADMFTKARCNIGAPPWTRRVQMLECQLQSEGVTRGNHATWHVGCDDLVPEQQ